MAESLRLADMSDRELLLAVAESLTEGYVTSVALAVDLGFARNGKPHPNGVRCVGSRLAALRRFGAVERHPERAPAHWTLTEVGELLAFGTLSDARRKALEGTKPAEALLTVRALASAQRGADGTVGRLMSREWRRQTELLNGQR